MKGNIMLRIFRTLLVVFSVVFFSTVVASAGNYYVITDVGAPEGYSNTTFSGHSLNDSGDMAITAYNSLALSRAFLNSEGAWTDLGVLDEERNYSAATGINSNGDVVGYSTALANIRHAFLWTAGGGMQDLGSLGGVMRDSHAHGINSSGMVVGYASLSNTYPPMGPHAFKWTASGGMVDLGTLGGSSASYASYAYAVNDSGQIVGYSTGSSAASQGEAFLYSNGAMSPLGTLGGNISVARGINADGDVVGYSKNSSGYEVGFLWTSFGGMVSLGSLEGGRQYSHAQDANDDGDVIVGQVKISGGGSRAGVYTGTPGTDGAWTDLNTLIKPDLGWTLTCASDVNGQGQIGGYGTIDGNTHAFLLTPAAAGDADLDGDVDNSDLGTAFGNYTGAGGTGKTWFTANFDGDGDVDNTDLGAAFGNYTGTIAGAGLTLLSSGDPSLADLIYDPATGNVKLDATEAAGGVITNFVLKNASGGEDFVTGVVNFPFTTFQEDLPTEISNTDGTLTGFSDVWDLGNVFVAGLDEASLSDWLTKATYVGALGTGVHTFDFVVVPEPGALALLFCALAGLLAYARPRRK